MLTGNKIGSAKTERGCASEVNSGPQAPLLENRYQILGLLGQGGMGAVYLARDLRFQQRLVALKENHARGYASQAQFRQEAEVLARLRHTHLPRVTDSFVAPDGRQFLVMDYIEGLSLEEYVTRHGPATEEQARAWMDQVLDALDYLHGQTPPIIHRDVKPANIRITPAGEAVLVDFGLTKLLTPGVLTASVVQKAGSPGYAPIEQYAGGTDQRSDVYGVGAAFYFALTGQPPVEAPLRAAGQTLPRPRQLHSSLSARMEVALTRSLAVNAGERFQSAGEMRAYLQGKSGPLDLGSGLARRFNPTQQKVGFGLLAALVVIVLTLGGWMGWTVYGQGRSGDKHGGTPPLTAIPISQPTATPAIIEVTNTLTQTPKPVETEEVNADRVTSTPKPTATPTATRKPPTATPMPTDTPVPTAVPTSIPPAPISVPECPPKPSNPCADRQQDWVCENGTWVCK